MIVGRSMHERWLSNAYVVGDAPGGTAVFVDSGAPLGPLLELVERENLTPTHLLRTHTHPDHIEHEDELCARFGIPVVTGDLVTGGLTCPRDRAAGSLRRRRRVRRQRRGLFHGRRAVQGRGRRRAGGGLPASVMQLMELPPATRVLPGHTDETTIGREFEHNPFVVYWRGVTPSLGEPVRVAGDEAELVVWSPDYDGNGKALVRFGDGREAIVGGSRVERG